MPSPSPIATWSCAAKGELRRRAVLAHELVRGLVAAVRHVVGRKVRAPARAARRSPARSRAASASSRALLVPCSRRPGAGARRRRRPWPWRRRSPWRGGCARPEAARRSVCAARHCAVERQDLRRTAAAGRAARGRGRTPRDFRGSSGCRASVRGLYRTASRVRLSRAALRLARNRCGLRGLALGALLLDQLAAEDRDLEQHAAAAPPASTWLNMSGGVSTAATTNMPTIA